MKPYFFAIAIKDGKTKRINGGRVGVTFADDLESAKHDVWAKYGGCNRCILDLREVPPEGTSFLSLWA